MTRTPPITLHQLLQWTTFYGKSLHLIIKGKHDEGLDRLLDGCKEDNVEAKMILANLYENGIAVDKNYANAIELYSEVYHQRYQLDSIEIAPVKQATIKSLNAKYDNAIALLRDFANKSFKKSEKGLSLHIYEDNSLIKNIKETYKAVEEFSQEYKAIREKLSCDARGKWKYRNVINIQIPFVAIKSCVIDEYINYLGAKLINLMSPDKRFVELLHNCISLLGDDEDRLEKGRKGIVGIAEQSGDELWNNIAGLWYEFGEYGRDPLEAGRYYALAGKNCEEDLERVKNKEEYQLLSDPKAGSGERCLELAKQYQYTSPILATQLALKAIAKDCEAAPHLTKLIQFDGSTIRYGGQALIEPRYIKLERLKAENDKAVQQYLSDAASKLKLAEEELEKAEAEEKVKEAERKAKEEAQRRAKREKEEAERRAREEAERKAKAPKLTLTLHNVHGTNNNLNIEYRFEGKNLYHKPNPNVYFDNEAEKKNTWHITAKIVECWSKNGNKKFENPKNAHTQIDVIVFNSNPIDKIVGEFIYASYIPIYEPGEFVLVLETTVRNPILSHNGVNILKKHSILIRLEPHIIRTTKLQVLDWDNRNRRDYVTHNN